MAVGDKLVTLDGLKAVYQDVNGNVNGLKSAVFRNAEIESSDIPAFNFSINSGNKWAGIASGANTSAGVIEIPKSVKMISVVPNTNGSVIAFLNSTAAESQATPDYSTQYPSRITSSDSSATLSYAVSGNMNYLYVLKTNSSAADTYPEITFGYYTDGTLTETGAAADAKAVGDAVGEVAGDVDELDAGLDALGETVTKATRNLFDKDHPNLINANFSSSGSTISGAAKTRTLYVPCKPNTAYVVMRKTGYYRFNVCVTTAVPASGVSYTYVAPTGVTVGEYEYRFFRTGSDSAYIAVYYYHADHDAESTLLGYLNSVMIYEGVEYLPYRPYASGYIGYNENRIYNTYGIFGVKFLRNESNPTVMRTNDAEGLAYRQQIGDVVSRSDFDHVFPWCEMRECNVTVDGSGNKTIVYSGETGFSRSNDTFVEVPAFYFKRTVVSGVEEWAVSGRPFSGADIEPWFLEEDGSIAKYRYIAKYEGAPTSTDHVSVTGVIPDTSQGMGAYRTYCEGLHYSLMSVQAHLAIAHLMVIETATLDVQSINQGISYFPFSKASLSPQWNKAKDGTITGVAGNTVTLPYKAEMANVLPGDTIYLSETGAQDTGNPRTVTSITVTPSTSVEITFDGNAYTITSDTYVFPAMQKTGKVDSLTYGSGRLNTGIHGAFSYRGIENLYGNVWEVAPGITWNYSTGKFSIGDDDTPYETSFTAPSQTATGSDTATEGWIKTLGYDRNVPWCTLPATVGGGKDTYIPDEWNTLGGTVDGQLFAVSGGWDHQSENGILNIRTSVASESSAFTNWLYGYRAMV